MDKALVVGGGVAGLLSAKILAKKGKKVLLVERAPGLGGLMKSEDNGGFTFDMGTHLLRETNSELANDYMFSGINEREWEYLGNLNVGHFSNGSLYKRSQFLDLRNFDKRVSQKIINEIISSKYNKISLNSAKSYLVSKFGETLYDIFFHKQLFKLFGQEGERLHYSCALIMSFNRVIGFDNDKSIERKKDFGLDERFAFNDFEQGASSLKNYYPKNSGIGLWVDNFEKELLNLGVEIKKEAEFSNLEFFENKVVSATVNGEKFLVDHLIWSLTPFFLTKILDVPVEMSPPLMRKVTLFNFEFCEPFLTNNFYVNCYDEEMLSFRITMYSNLRSDVPPRCTVEVFSGIDLDEAEATKIIHDELIKMKLVNKENRLLRSFMVCLPGVPALTKDLVDGNRLMSEGCLEKCKNLTFVGRAQGNIFFMNDIITDTVEKLH